MKNLFKSLILLLLCAFSLAGCTSVPYTDREDNKDYCDYQFFSMNTSVSLTIYGKGTEQANIAVRDRTLELENKWSVTVDTSEIYKINHADGANVIVSDDTRDLIEFSLKIAERTDGNFEPTIYPIVRLWGFTTKQFYVPTDEEITNALSFVGYQKVEMLGNEVSLPIGMSLDFGAVGKGYALDEAIKVLKARGITSALVNFGGNIGLIGTKSDGERWKIGVKSPLSDGDFGTLSLADCSVATSGNYQRYFEDENGNRYGHIMNPVTGKPTESNILSVTVVSKEGKICDALATAIYVMGIEKAIDLYRNSNDFELVLLSSDGNVYLTEGLSDSFTLENDLLSVITVKKESV